MAKKKQKFYAVAVGARPGIYRDWYGKDGAEPSIKAFPGAKYKSFPVLGDAVAWMREMLGNKWEVPGELLDEVSCDPPEKTGTPDEAGRVVIYTDGGAINNPGPGGYGAVLSYGGHEKELSGGFRSTTNNRMELLACIVGLSALKRRCKVVLYSDSKYVVDGIMKGWARRWKEKGWMRNSKEPAENTDLWKRLLDLCDRHEVLFQWVKGHNGNPGNERCDQLATGAARGEDLPPDENFESGKTKLAK